MRVVNKEGQVEKIICNSCGKELKIDSGICREDYLSIDKKWGYFSQKDGENHRLDLCEDCYDQWINHLKLAVTVIEETELL